MDGCFNEGCVHKAKKVEGIRIKMSLDKKAYARHAHAVTTLVPRREIDEDEILSVTYTFTASYFNDVVAKLEAVKKICSDPDVVISASCTEITQGRILIYEALKRLDTVIAEIDKR